MLPQIYILTSVFASSQQIINDNFPRQSVFNSWWNKGFWIGLTDVALPGTWVWVDNVTLSDAM